MYLYIVEFVKSSNLTSAESISFYNPKNSKTSKNTSKSFEVRYGTGYCKGYYYQDQIKFLSNENMSVIILASVSKLLSSATCASVSSVVKS